MPTPKKGYFAADGTKLPSVTTILGRFKESDALMYWAWKTGMAGIDYREARNKAADVGNLAHAMIEAHIRGEPVAIEGDPEKVAKARSSFDAYLAWEQSQNVRFIWTEHQFVSEAHRFGGTPDALGMVGNRVILLDWKTSNAVYPDHLIQLAAYGALVREAEPETEISEYMLCRFSKEHGDFSVHRYEDLSSAWRMFLCLREAYDLDKELKKRAA